MTELKALKGEIGFIHVNFGEVAESITEIRIIGDAGRFCFYHHDDPELFEVVKSHLHKREFEKLNRINELENKSND